jgi:hypothetical protein
LLSRRLVWRWQWCCTTEVLDDESCTTEVLDGEDAESEDGDDNFESGNNDDSKDDDDEEEEETVDAKRLWLAREYLDKMEATRASVVENVDGINPMTTTAQTTLWGIIS